jgi:tetratricopeptide (TPR) repeat protein
MLGAEEAAKAAISAAPQMARAHAALGQVREQQNRHEEAIDLYRVAIGIDPRDDAREKLAAVLKLTAMSAILQRERPLAIERFLALQELNSKTVNLGSGADLLRDEAREEYNKAAKTKDPAEARTHLERSLRLLPGNFYALYALGTIEAEAGGDDHTNDARAMELWLRAMEAAKATGLDLSEFALHYNLAQLNYRSQQYAPARELLREYIGYGKGPFQDKAKALLTVVELKLR